MSVLRSVVKSFGVLLFTTGFAFYILTIVLANLTTYENLKPIFTSMIIDENIKPETLDIILVGLRQECKGKNRIEFQSEFGNITLKCDEVNKAGVNVKELFTTAVFDKIYYTKYNCSIIDCIRSEPIAIMSAQGNAFFLTFQAISFMISAFGCGLILLAGKNWVVRIKSIGLSMIYIGIPYFVIDILVSRMEKSISIPISKVDIIIESIVTPMKTYFLYTLLAGIILTIVSYGLSVKKRSRKK